MRKARDIIGLPVLTLRNARKVGEVHDLLFDPTKNRVLAFLVDEGGWFDAAKVVPFDHVHSVGEDAIIIEDDRDIVPAERNKETQRALQSGRVVTHMRVFTEDGRDLGTIGDMFIDDKTGEVQGYEVSGGFLATTLRGKQFMPAPETLTMGKNIAYVPSATGDKMEQQVTGGLQAGVQKVGTAAQQAAASVQEQTSRLTSASKEQQISFIEGKKADTTIKADGRVIVRANETISRTDAEEADRAGVLAQLVGSVVSAQAKETGGRASGLAQAKAGQARGKAPTGGETLQQGANTALDDIKNAISNLTRTSEQQLINSALGRPVSRVILDQNDDVILNTGEIITHLSIQRAREAGALDVLLSSAVRTQPKLDQGDLYAPEPGKASLETEHPELRRQTEPKAQPEPRMRAEPKGHPEKRQ